MAGPNTTGKPQTNDYNLGRGKLYFSALVNDLPLAWQDLGNAPEFNLAIESETLDHQSSREGLKSVDKEVIISQSLTCSFSLDEINHENLARVFSGEKATHTNAAIAGFSEYTMVAEGEIKKGHWYDIKNSSGARAYDITAGDLTVKTTNGTPVTLVLNTDYEVDATMGRIFLLSTSTELDTAISNVEGLDVTLAAKAGAKAVNEVRGLTKTNVIGALKFIAENPADNDKKTEFQFHKITLKADGDMALIGDDWTTLPFTGAAEKNETADSDSPTLTVRTVAA